jgi:WD40 repeat protein
MANEEVEALGAREAMALKLHSNNITCAAFWSEEDLVCTGSMDNTLMLWRVRDGWNHRLRAHCGWVTCCAFQPRGSMLASGILVAVALFCPYARSLSALQVSFDACSRQVCKCQ